jgi:SH3 domain-containing YSC84-like protein 1
MNKVFLNFSKMFVLALALAVSANTAFAQQNAKENRKEAKEAQETSSKAASLFSEIMGDADKAIPGNLLERAEAVAIFPGVVNAAFIVGGRGGQGLIVRRTQTGWGAPAFFKLGGGSLGAQIGGQKVDYIMLIMNDGGLKGLLEDKFEFGGELNVAAGPVGRETSATTNATLDAGIITYSRARGLFAGVSLKGAVISPDNDRNQAIYQMNAKDILSETSKEITQPDYTKVVPQTLSRFSTRKGTTVTPNSGTR